MQTTKENTSKKVLYGGYVEVEALDNSLIVAPKNS